MDTSSPPAAFQGPAIYIPCADAEEARLMIEARDNHRRRLAAAQAAPEPNKPDPERVAAILRGLTKPPIKHQVVKEYLSLLYDAPPDDDLTVREIAKTLKVDVVTISGVASRLSARMKKVMLERDKGLFKKSVHLLTDVSYEPGSNQASHKLTASGREAVRQYLGR